MSLKAQLEALIYAAEEPITLDQMAALLKDDLLARKTAAQAAQESAVDPAQQSQPAERADNYLGAVEDAPEVRRVKRGKEKSEKAELRALLKPYLEELIADYAGEGHGIEVRE